MADQLSRKIRQIPLSTRFGSIEVVKFHGLNADRDAFWECRCDCGKVFITRGTEIRAGKVKTCGCRINRKVSHKRERYVYRMMVYRCSCPKSTAYDRYGGRGIRVCDRWLGPDGFWNFLADMGRCPSSAHSIDRIDNDGPYSPANCRWALKKQQCRNRSSSRLVTVNGQTKTLVEWAEISGIKETTISFRLRKGMAPEMAITQPVMSPREAAALAGELSRKRARKTDGR